jgi:hypothetical protein
MKRTLLTVRYLISVIPNLAEGAVRNLLFQWLTSDLANFLTPLSP